MKEYLNILDEKDFTIFKEIELLREKVISQDKSIAITDYGAGNTADNRSIEQMHNGVKKAISTKELCKIGLKNDYAHLIYAVIKKSKPLTILELETCCGLCFMGKEKLS